MERIDVLMAADDNYLQHLGVALISVLENTRSPKDFYITVLDGGITVLQKVLLENVIEKYGATLEFRKIDLKNPEKYHVNGHISITAYYRIMLPQVYEPMVKRVIYLDCDVIVNADLKELFETDLKGNVVGAVAAPASYRMEELGFPGKPYFNSGVLLIDLEKWLEEGMTAKVMDFIYQNPKNLIYWDQDALNACLNGKWLPLDKTWNYMRSFVLQNKDWRAPVTNLPKIVHFSNNTKPWLYYSRNPYDYLYFKYLSLSPWRDFKPTGRTLRKIISKNLKLALRKANLFPGM